MLRYYNVNNFSPFKKKKVTTLRLSLTCRAIDMSVHTLLSRASQSICAQQLLDRSWFKFITIFNVHEMLLSFAKTCTDWHPYWNNSCSSFLISIYCIWCVYSCHRLRQINLTLGSWSEISNSFPYLGLLPTSSLVLAVDFFFESHFPPPNCSLPTAPWKWQVFDNK